MEKTIIIGIDPGEHGGIAVISNIGTVIGVDKMPPTPYDIYNYLYNAQRDAELNGYACKVYLENVGHGLPGQSSSATAKFARHCGHLEMALLALKMKTETVTPQKWQKEFQMGSSKGLSKTEWKNKLKAKAQQLFPEQNITLATADALLIAEYGRKDL